MWWILKRLLVGIVVLFIVVYAYLLFQYATKGYVKVDLPVLGRIDVNRLLLQEGYQLGLNYYGPVKKDDKMFLLGRVVSKSVDLSGNIDLLVLAVDKNNKKTIEFSDFKEMVFYYQIPPARLDRFLGAFRYKRFRKMRGDLVHEEDWFSVLYDQDRRPLIVTKLNTT